MPKTPRAARLLLLPEAVAFQPDAIKIEELPPPRAAKLTLWVILAAFATAVIWSALAKVDRLVVAPGKLVTREPLIVLHPLETSIVRRFDVNVGDKIKAGQTLVELDPTFSSADVLASQGELDSLEAQIARLGAELAGESTIPDGGKIPADSLRIEQRLLTDRIVEARSRLDGFRSRERRAQIEIDESPGLEANLRQRRKNIDEVVQWRTGLVTSGAVSRLQLILSENELLSVDQELAQLNVRRRSLEEEVQTVLADREAFTRERRRQATEQLIEARRQRDRIVNVLTKSQRRSNLGSLESPVDGIVLDKARLSIGSVAQSAQAVLTLVPATAVLQGEIEIPAKDIAQVREGRRCRRENRGIPFPAVRHAAGAAEVDRAGLEPEAGERRWRDKLQSQSRAFSTAARGGAGEARPLAGNGDHRRDRYRKAGGSFLFSLSGSSRAG
jgi:hemolysin D